MKTGLIAVVSVAAFAGLIFSVFPGFDLWFSGLFYDAETGFIMRGHPVGDFFHRQLDDGLKIIFAAVLILSVFAAALRRPVFGIRGRDGVMIAAVLAIAVGLIVNLLLKEYWGRARPDDIAAFGGGLSFSPALLPSDQCNSNCSFPSGHAAFGFATISLAMIAKRRKALWYGIAIMFGSVVGLQRVMRGSHFLSDIIFSAVIVIFVAFVTQSLIENMTRKERVTGP